MIELTNKDITINECKLLSAEDAKKCDMKTLRNWTFWWLGSPGTNPGSVSYYNADGALDIAGDFVHREYAIRPALYCTLKSEEANSLYEGDEVEINGKRFIYLHSGIFLLAVVLNKGAKSVFRHDVRAKDSTDYEKSDIKKIIDEWFERNFADFNSNDISESRHNKKGLNSNMNFLKKYYTEEQLLKEAFAAGYKAGLNERVHTAHNRPKI